MAENRKAKEPAALKNSTSFPPPGFPTHNSPRVWLITQALSPLAVRLIKLLLGHGDSVVACVPPLDANDAAVSADFRQLAVECNAREGWKDRIRVIRCDSYMRGQCGSAVAEAVAIFGRIDIMLLCSSIAVVGSVEELDGSSLVGEQFQISFFSQVNFIQAVLPTLRAQENGHIIALSSIGGHIGTPGMPITTAATWAFEGYCDSLAYEVAPFNIKVTIVQPPTEALLFTNKIAFAPIKPEYETAAAVTAAAAAAASPAAKDKNSNAPADDEGSPEPQSRSSFRGMLFNFLDEHGSPPCKPLHETVANAKEAVRQYPRLPPRELDKLLFETVHALTAIGGLGDPPTRHIVGYESALAVEEKLQIVTEELEEFVETSLSVDIYDSELKREARRGKAPDPPVQKLEPEPEQE